MQYGIFSEDGRRVGNATVVPKGLYLQIECRCSLPQYQRWRIFVHTQEKKTDLGLCSKRQGDVGLYTCIPEKKVGTGALRFLVAEERKGEYVPLDETKPCPCISRLRRGRLAVCKDTVMIEFTN